MRARSLAWAAALVPAAIAACASDDSTPATTPNGVVDAAVIDASADFPDGSAPDAAGSDSAIDVDGAAPLEDGELAPGGATTTTDTDAGAFAEQAANLGIDRRSTFEAGLQFFQVAWEKAPGRAETDGLGPTYVADACPACHVHDGRGHLDTVLLRIGLGPDGGVDPNYGLQLQPFAVAGASGEGTPRRIETTIDHLRADGTTAPLVGVSYAVDDLHFGPFGDDVRLSARIAPQLVGQGLLEAVSDADIVANEDPDDRDGDGISGRAHRTSSGAIGRFGWKAAQPSIDAQVAAAFAEDVGITSSFHPDANCPGAQTTCASTPNGGEPEINDARLATTVAYVRLLGVPPRRDGAAHDVLVGKALFAKVGCASCHRPSFTTTAATSEVALASQKIWPYTDLLLHDLGEGLADHRVEGDAGEREWRTAPLWSIGLLTTVGGERRLLHDGRATTIDEAVMWHDGEAASARQKYEALVPAERALVDRFVDSL
ncbi:MAG TPA: di-heme oxidoredictase family protein [Polyangiaceae bacterium]